MQSRLNHPNYSQLGFRSLGFTPRTLVKGALALCFPSQFDTYTTTFRSTPQLRWIGVVLWILAGVRGLGFQGLSALCDVSFAFGVCDLGFVVLVVCRFGAAGRTHQDLGLGLKVLGCFDSSGLGFRV